MAALAKLARLFRKEFDTWFNPRFDRRVQPASIVDVEQLQGDIDWMGSLAELGVSMPARVDPADVNFPPFETLREFGFDGKLAFELHEAVPLGAEIASTVKNAKRFSADITDVEVERVECYSTIGLSSRIRAFYSSASSSDKQQLRSWLSAAQGHAVVTGVYRGRVQLSFEFESAGTAGLPQGKLFEVGEAKLQFAWKVTSNTTIVSGRPVPFALDLARWNGFKLKDWD